jgi:hypothetical protein
LKLLRLESLTAAARAVMSRRAMLPLAVALTACAASSGRAALAEAKPCLVVEQAEQDVGIREPGEPVEFVFRLKNTGSAPLEIVDARPNCGCVVAGYDRMIPAGGAGTVTARLETAGRHGPQRKRVTVFSNDSENPGVPLTMKVTLRHPIEVSPSSDLTFPMQRGQGAEQAVTLYASEATPLQITRIESTAPYVTATVAAVADEDLPPGATGASRQGLHIQILPTAPETAFAATITVHTNNKRMPRVVLNVNGYPEGSVMAHPPRVYLSDIPSAPKDPIVRSILLMKRGGTFELVKAESSDPALQLQPLGRTPGPFCEVALRYSGGWKPGLIKGTLVFTTTDPLRPRVEVPFVAEVEP